MFSRKEHLLKKTGSEGIGRYEFLKQLINEFTTSTSFEQKRQVLANLANFAYDPINFEYMKQLHLIDLFLAQLSEDCEELINFALAGLCNIACDPESKEYIISLNGIYLTSQFLFHKNEEISLNSLTILFYLFESDSAELPGNLKDQVLKYERSQNIRLQNLGKVFLNTYYSSESIIASNSKLALKPS